MADRTQGRLRRSESEPRGDESGNAASRLPFTSGLLPLPSRTDFRSGVNLFLAYTLACVLGLQWAVIAGAGSPVWPAAGVGLAGLLLGGLRLWPALVLGRLAAAILTGSGQPLWVEVIIAGGNAVATALPAALLLRHNRLDFRLTAMRDILRLAVAGALSAFLAACVGVGALNLSVPIDAAQSLDVGRAWWFGVFVGNMIFAPLILTWSRREAWAVSQWKLLGLVLLLVLTASLSLAVFLYQGSFYFRTWYVFATLVVVAIGYQVRGAAPALLVTNGFAIWGATIGVGSFAVLVGDPVQRVELAQHFAAVTTVATLLLAAAADERRGLEALRRSEARLRESEAHYRSFIELNTQVTWTADAAGNIIEVSPRWTEWTGMSEAEAMQGSWLAVLHPEDRHAVIEAIHEALQTGQPLDREARLISADGGWRWVRARVFPRLDETGAILRWYGHAEDVHARRSAEEAVRVERDRSASYLEVAGVMLLILDPDRCIRTINRRGVEVLGYSDATELVGRDWYELAIPEEVRDEVRASFDAMMSGEAEWIESSEGEVVRADGSRRLMAWRNTALRNEAREIVGLVASGEDVTERRAAEAQIQFLARHDPLTGLPNRTLFAERLADAMKRADQDKSHVGLVLLDLDRFKEVNDTLGHAVGDVLLRVVTERLTGALRRGDTAARFGGDEFAVVLADLRSPADVEMLSQRICSALVGPAKLDSHIVEVGASFGTVSYPEDGSDIGRLMRHADLALYQAKDNPEKSIVAFHSGFAAAAVARAQMASELREAVAQNALVLHYQPQVDLRTGQVSTVEALVRWSRSGTLIPPAEFIPVAETSGAIRALGAWVLGRACAQQARWRSEGRNLTVAINVSPAQVGDDDFLRVVDEAMRQADTGRGALEFEITEGLLLDTDKPSVRSFLEACQERRIGLALDDFGIGYSSLGYLGRLPIARLKIDRSFVAKIGQPEGDTLIEAMIDLGHRLGKRVVAEGVETVEQLEHLRTLGCDEAQGYLFSPPTEVAGIEAFLRSRAP